MANKDFISAIGISLEIDSEIDWADLGYIGLHPQSNKVVMLCDKQGRKYGMSVKRWNAAERKAGLRCFVSENGKWLIPADTVSSIDVDW